MGTWLRFDNVISTGALVAIATFLLKYIVDGVLVYRNGRIVRKKLLLALHTEVHLNVKNLEEGIRAFPSLPAIFEHLRKTPQSYPHFIFKFSSDIYKSRTTLIAELPDIMVKNIIEFYGSLEYIDLAIKSLDRRSYETISAAGRDGIIMEIQRSLELASSSGDKLLDAFNLISPGSRVR